MTTGIADSPVIASGGTTTLSWRHRLLALTPGLISGLYLIWSGGVTTSTGRRFTLFDDAMISMAYARTLARGGGLVWYEGAPRVEGITNPLWTFYMAFLHALGLEGSSAALAVALTGLATVLVTALAAGRITRSIRPGTPVAELAAIIIVPLLFPLMLWSVRGMEVGLICACTFVRSRWPSGCVNHTLQLCPLALRANGGPKSWLRSEHAWRSDCSRGRTSWSSL